MLDFNMFVKLIIVPIGAVVMVFVREWLHRDLLGVRLSLPKTAADKRTYLWTPSKGIEK